MLTIEILESEDFDSIGEYTFNFPVIQIGTKIKSTLRIYDQSVKESLYIKINESDTALLIHRPKNGFLCNSKRYFISKIIKKDDVIQIGELKMKVTSISSEGPFPTDIKKKRLELLQSVRNKDTRINDLLESIEQDLLSLGLS
jgi:hypothetical protein